MLRLVASAASAGAALVGLVTLGAWLAGLSLGGPDLTMKPVTALAVLLIACAILPQLPLGPPWRIACGAIAALLAASSLIQEFGGLDFRLESWLAPATAPGPTPGDFHMSPATAVAVLLAGYSFCCAQPGPQLVAALAAGEWERENGISSIVI
jgi:hypothetical protein